MESYLVYEDYSSEASSVLDCGLTMVPTIQKKKKKKKKPIPEVNIALRCYADPKDPLQPHLTHKRASKSHRRLSLAEMDFCH